MENESSLDRQFREVVADCNFDETSVEQRMLSASTDMQLVIAVHDELSALISATFCDRESSLMYQQNYDNARDRLMEIITNLQYSYNLTDTEMLGAVELTRGSIQLGKTTLD